MGFWRALFVGLLLFWVTHNPIAGAIVPSLQAGWRTLALGIRLLAVDPLKSRARICFLFYLATALWKAAAAACLSVVVYVLVFHLTEKVVAEEAFVTTIVTLWGAVAISTILGWIAAFAAVVYRVRVWVHPSFLSPQHDDVYIESYLASKVRQFNYAVFVVGTSLVFPAIVLGCYLLATSFAPATPNDIDARQMTVSFLLIFGVPLAVLPVYAWLSARIIARSPIDSYLSTDDLIIGTRGDTAP